MKTTTQFSLLASLALSIVPMGCGSDGSSAIDAQVAPTIDAAIPDAAPPDAAINPRCEIKSGEDVALVEVATGLRSPLLVTAPQGDPRLFIIEQDGIIRIVEDGNVNATPFLDIRSIIASVGNEQGLLGLAFHPEYATNGKFYVYYTARSPADDVVVAEYTVSDDADLANATGRILLTIDEPRRNHNGGMIAFGPAGYLTIAVGDGGKQGDPDGNAQNLNIHLGKLLRIDVDSKTLPYGIPADNPFASGGGLPEIWAYGLRNPWRFSFDSQTGDIYIGDVGQGSREEINVQPGNAAGVNYGWKIMEGIECFNSPNCDRTGLTLPVTDYPHTQGRVSITGGYVYRGTCSPDIAGWYFFADFASQQIYTFEYDGTAANLTELFLDPTNQIGGITSFGQDGFGELYVVSRNGRIFQIVVN